MAASLLLVVAVDLGGGRATAWPSGDLIEVEELVQDGHGAALLLRTPGRAWGRPVVQCRAAYSLPNGGLLACEGWPARTYSDPAALGELLDEVEAAALLLRW